MHSGKSLILGLGLLAASLQPGFAQDEYVFGFPPREGEAKAVAVYQPIADFLTKATGKKFVLRYNDNWLGYQSAMQRDQFDLVFDGPHFIGWRQTKLQHTPLVRLDGNLTFAIVSRKDNTRVKSIKDLTGRRICGMAPPNLATLSFFGQFDNPSRQPVLMRAQSFKDAFESVVNKHCEAGVVQVAMVEKFDKGQQTAIIFKTKPLPNQGFTASSRIPADVQEKVRTALLSEEGKAATAKLRAEYNNRDLIPTDKPEYEGLGVLLRDVWGFEL
jgi:ABC-type phosphate/phosphonate transport system substrate-binding protein